MIKHRTTLKIRKQRDITIQSGPYQRVRTIITTVAGEAFMQNTREMRLARLGQDQIRYTPTITHANFNSAAPNIYFYIMIRSGSYFSPQTVVPLTPMCRKKHVGEYLYIFWVLCTTRLTYSPRGRDSLSHAISITLPFRLWKVRILMKIFQERVCLNPDRPKHF